MEKTNVKYLKDYSVSKFADGVMIRYLLAKGIDNANYLMVIDEEVKIFERADTEEFTNLVHCFKVEICNFMRKLEVTRINRN